MLIGLGLVLTVARAGAALEGGSLATPERLPHVRTIVVQPGDSLWSLAHELAPERDPRSVVDALVEARGTSTLAPGETVTWLENSAPETPTTRKRPQYVGHVQCPYCRTNDDKVVDSRLAEDQAAIRRRRECLACGRRFTTYERVEDVPVVVRKRSGETEPFDRAKLRSGIASAATGRLDDAAIDTIVAEIDEELRAEGAEFGTDRIGMAVLERLRRVDPVAYLRFASVYKGFEDLADFETELQKITAPKRR